MPNLCVATCTCTRSLLQVNKKLVSRCRVNLLTSHFHPPSVQYRAVYSNVPGTPVRVVATKNGGVNDGANDGVRQRLPTPTAETPANKQPEPTPANDSPATCQVCLNVIVETSTECADEDAFFCEGYCNCWVHRCCAGLTKPRFAKICASEDPFFCPNCTVAKQALEITELRKLYHMQ